MATMKKETRGHVEELENSVNGGKLVIGDCSYSSLFWFALNPCETRFCSKEKKVIAN